jgi:hypothetical protein
MRRGEGQQTAHPQLLLAVDPFRDVVPRHKSTLTVGDKGDVGTVRVMGFDPGLQDCGTGREPGLRPKSSAIVVDRVHVVRLGKLGTSPIRSGNFFHVPVAEPPRPWMNKTSFFMGLWPRFFEQTIYFGSNSPKYRYDSAIQGMCNF